VKVTVKWLVTQKLTKIQRPQKNIPNLEQHLQLSKDWTKVVATCFSQLLTDLNADLVNIKKMAEADLAKKSVTDGDFIILKKPTDVANPDGSGNLLGDNEFLKADSALYSKELWKKKLQKLQYFTQLSRSLYDENLLHRNDFMREFLKIFKLITDKGEEANQISVLISFASVFLDQFQLSRFLLMQLLSYSIMELTKVYKCLISS
jgi:hypothetical protein